MVKNSIILFFVILVNLCFAEIRITSYVENIKFTDYGREVNVKIKASVSLENRYYYSSWSYIFDKKQKIEILDAKVIEREHKWSFQGNQLKFDFADVYNGQTLDFEFNYKENSKNQKYNRQEWVSVPPFAEGAMGELVVEVPNNLEVYSLHPQFIQNQDIYTWKNKVLKGGFSDSFFLTLKKAKWKTTYSIDILLGQAMKGLEVTIPQFFKNGDNNIESYDIKTQGKYELKGNKIKIKFDDNLNLSKAQIRVIAILNKSYDTKYWVKTDPMKALKIDTELSKNLQSILHNIKQTNDPLHVRIADWVHNYITYDLRYFGKEMTTEQILRVKGGVCEQYAQLYNDLLRASGIPSIIVSGSSYDTEKDTFENHAWNLVHVNGEWVGIDPTWGIYSGKLPISHIFFNIETSKPELQWTTYTTGTESKLNRNVEFIE